MRRWSLRIIVVIVIMLGAVWLTAFSLECVLRWRAERLMADVKALEVNKSSWVDLQRFMTRWGSWGGYNGSCNAEACDYIVGLSGSAPYWTDDKDEWKYVWVVRGLRFAGLQDAGVSAGISVRRGMVTTKHIGAYMNNVEATAGESSSLPSFAKDRALHPNHAFERPKSYMFFAAVTPDEAASERSKLFDIRFSCITSILHCTEPRDLMPMAYKEYEDEKTRVREFDPAHCDLRYWITARDASALLVADVVSAKLETTTGDGQASEPYWVVAVRSKEMLKGKLAIPAGASFFLQMFPRRFPAGQNGAFRYTKLIMAGRAFSPEDVEMYGPFEVDDECDVVEATDANLVAAREGVRKDFGRHGGE